MTDIHRGQIAVTCDDLRQLLNLADDVTITHLFVPGDPHELRVVVEGPRLPSVAPRSLTPLVSLHLVAKGADGEG